MIMMFHWPRQNAGAPGRPLALASLSWRTMITSLGHVPLVWPPCRWQITAWAGPGRPGPNHRLGDDSRSRSGSNSEARLRPAGELDALEKRPPLRLNRVTGRGRGEAAGGCQAEAVEGLRDSDSAKDRNGCVDAKS
jgi:hypothetical protein